MASWSTRTRTITRHEWVVPLHDGQCVYADLMGAVHAAESELAADTHTSLEDLTDDALMIQPHGEEIIVYYASQLKATG